MKVFILRYIYPQSLVWLLITSMKNIIHKYVISGEKCVILEVSV